MVSKKLLYLGIALWSLPTYAADGLEMNMAQMQAMDKITGRVSLIEVPVGGAVHFGSFSVVIRSCQTRPEGEVPENFAFADITDKSFDQTEYNIFKGWMFSSSPAVHAVEHPIYDVWLLKCFNGSPKTADLLTPEALAARDELPRLQDVRSVSGDADISDSKASTPTPIRFKDSMYKEDARPQTTRVSEPKKVGAPENLLNIQESYEEPTEEMLTLPSDELSEAINREVEQLSAANPETAEKTAQSEDIQQSLKAAISELEKTSESEDELSEAINRELSARTD